MRGKFVSPAFFATRVTPSPSHPVSQLPPLCSGAILLTLGSPSTLQLTLYSGDVHPAQALDSCTLSCSYS